MKIIVGALVLFASSFSFAEAFWRSSFEFPDDDGVNYAACLEELTLADENQDGELNSEEYEDFVQGYKERILCGDTLEGATDVFTSSHEAAFRSLACLCRCREGHACCEGENAHVETAGADTDDRTRRQQYYLTTVCQVTDGSITEPRCSELAPPTSSLQSNLEEGETSSLQSTLEEGEEQDKKKGDCSFGITAAIVVGSLLALALVVAGLAGIAKKRRNKKSPPAALPAKVAVDEGTVVDEDESTASPSISGDGA